MSLFSIIIPVYNMEQYLGRCVDSILQQDFCDFELILVDDGSSDNSPVICDNYAKSDNRIRVIHKKNGGVSSARNCGILEATGDYFWFVDSDDFIQPNALSDLDAAIKEQDADLYVFNKERQEKFSGTLTELFELHYFTYHLGFEPWNKLYKASIIKDNELLFDQEETVGEDLLFNICYYQVMKGNVFFLNKQLYNYVIRPGSAMNSKAKKRLVQQLRLFDKEKNLLENQVSKEILQTLFLLHMISGVGQSRTGGLTSKEFSCLVPYYRYKKWFAPNKYILKNFFSNEKASILGKVRIRVFLFFMRRGKYTVAGKIMGLSSSNKNVL